MTSLEETAQRLALSPVPTIQLTSEETEALRKLFERVQEIVTDIVDKIRAALRAVVQAVACVSWVFVYYQHVRAEHERERWLMISAQRQWIHLE